MSVGHSNKEFELSSRRRLDPVQWFFGGVINRWHRHRMIRAFEAMDDRLLRDIGLERGDIEALVASFDDRELRMVPVAPTGLMVGTGQQA